MKVLLMILFMILSCSCSNLDLRGNLAGTERGMSNEFNISSSLSDRYRLKSKISKPYDYDTINLPIYCEHSVEILF